MEDKEGMIGELGKEEGNGWWEDGELKGGKGVKLVGWGGGECGGGLGEGEGGGE